MEEIKVKGYNHLKPDPTLEICEENLKSFFKMIFNRQEIWYNRWKGNPKPWSEDDILNNNKFTNNYRELDRQSQFLLSKIIIPFGEGKSNEYITASDDVDLLYYYIIFFKIFNNLDFFKFLSEELNYKIPLPHEYDSEEFLEIMTVAKENGISRFTNAYLTNSAAYPGVSRDYTFSKHIIPQWIKSYKHIREHFQSPEKLVKFLNSHHSCSNFMSHEFYQDFCYIGRYTNIQDFPFNVNDYTNVGPGAQQGLELIFPNRSGNKKALKQGIYDLKEIADLMLSNFGDFKYIDWDKNNKVYYLTDKREVTLHLIEMALCEYQKYWKMVNGVGKQRSKYTQQENKDYSFYLY